VQTSCYTLPPRKGDRTGRHAACLPAERALSVHDTDMGFGDLAGARLRLLAGWRLWGRHVASAATGLCVRLGNRTSPLFTKPVYRAATHFWDLALCWAPNRFNREEVARSPLALPERPPPVTFCLAVMLPRDWWGWRVIWQKIQTVIHCALSDHTQYYSIQKCFK